MPGGRLTVGRRQLPQIIGIRETGSHWWFLMFSRGIDGVLFGPLDRCRCKLYNLHHEPHIWHGAKIRNAIGFVMATSSLAGREVEAAMG